MRQVKTILKQAEHFRNNALTSPAAFRLYIYVPWKDIPAEMKEYFSEAAEKDWEQEISLEDVEKDIEYFMATILETLSRRSTVQGLMLVPLVLADMFMLGVNTGAYEGRYHKIVNQYTEDIDFDSVLAEIDVLQGISKLLKDIANKLKIALEFDIEQVVRDIIELHEKVAVQNQGPNQSIDEAIERYENVTGESLFEGIEDGVDLSEELQAVKDELGSEVDEKQ